MQHNNVMLEVLAHKKPVEEYYHEGKTFVESRDGSTYSIRVKNDNSHRVKVVISVDGLSIITGKPVSDSPEETGYILGPNEEQIYRGYRLSDNEVAAFTFVKRDKSYATETGAGQGNGVIALRAYSEFEDPAEKKLKDLQRQFEEFKNRPREKEYVPYYPWHPSRPWRWSEPDWTYRPDIWTTCGSAMGVGGTSFNASLTCGEITNENILCNASTTLRCTTEPLEIKPQSFDMGSSFGTPVKEAVTHVAFETGKLIAEIAIYYASLEGLKSLGVNVTREKAVAFPEPFRHSYCQPPKDWKSGVAR